MNMIFPGIEPVIDEKGVNVEKFDELFKKAVAQQPDGFFAFTFQKPGETDTIYLFVVNGHPYGAGMIEKGNPAFFNVKEFFDIFSKHGTGEIIYYKVERKLLQCLLIYFSKEPSQKFASDMVDMEKVLTSLETAASDSIIALKSGNRVEFSISLKGRLSFNFFIEPSPADEQPRDALLVYIYGQQDPPITLEIFNDIRPLPASDAIHPKTELPKSLIEHYSTPPVPSLIAKAGVTLMLDNKVVGRFLISKPETIIGRNPGSDILIENPGVSRQHALIREEDGRFIIEDKGSANGTFVESEKITSRELKDGDRIKILKYEMLFNIITAKSEGEEGETEKTMYIESPVAKEKKVVIPILKLDDGQEFKIKSSITTIGSDENMGIRLDGRLISGHQASILMSKDGIATLSSSTKSLFSSTKVNGKSVTQQVLHDGDVIEIGKYKMVYKVQ